MRPDTYKSAQSFFGSRGPGHKCAKYKLYLNKIKKATPERDHPVTGRSLSDLNNSKQFRFIAGNFFGGFHCLARMWVVKARWDLYPPRTV